MTGCSSDDPKFVKRDTCHLSRSEDGEMRWYVDGKSMTVDQFKTQVAGYKWAQCSRELILEDGTLEQIPAADGASYIVMHVEDGVIHNITGGAGYRTLTDIPYQFAAGDDMDYLPNNILPVEIDEEGNLCAIEWIEWCYVPSIGMWPHCEYVKFRKIGDEEFQHEVEVAKFCMENIIHNGPEE